MHRSRETLGIGPPQGSTGRCISASMEASIRHLLFRIPRPPSVVCASGLDRDGALSSDVVPTRDVCEVSEASLPMHPCYEVSYVALGRGTQTKLMGDTTVGGRSTPPPPDPWTLFQDCERHRWPVLRGPAAKRSRQSRLWGGWVVVQAAATSLRVRTRWQPVGTP